MDSIFKDLINKDLKGFTIVEMTEVYTTDYDGRKLKSLGFFRNPVIATAFANGEKSAFNKTDKAFVLTDGITGYIINEQQPVKLFDEEEEALRAKERALEKLTPEDRDLLGLK